MARRLRAGRWDDGARGPPPAANGGPRVLRWVPRACRTLISARVAAAQRVAPGCAHRLRRHLLAPLASPPDAAIVPVPAPQPAAAVAHPPAPAARAAGPLGAPGDVRRRRRRAGQDDAAGPGDGREPPGAPRRRRVDRGRARRRRRRRARPRRARRRAPATGPRRRARAAAPRTRPAPPAPDAVADAVWQRSPAAVCLVFDDVHLLPVRVARRELVGRPGRRAARRTATCCWRGGPTRRCPWPAWAAHGELLQIGEDDLRFTERRGGQLRRDRGVADVGPPGGDRGLAGDDRAGRQRARRPGRRLPVGGGARPAGRASPPGARRARRPRRGRRRPRRARSSTSRSTWAPCSTASRSSRPTTGAGGCRTRCGGTVPALALAPTTAAGSAGAGRSTTTWPAVGSTTRSTLATDTGLDDVVPSILRAACLGPDGPPVDRLARWLGATLPADARRHQRRRPRRRAAPGVGRPGRRRSSPSARPPTLFRADGRRRRRARRHRPAGPRGVVAGAGRRLGELFPRVLELEAEGHPLARALAGIGRAVLADLDGDDATVLAVLDGIEPGCARPGRGRPSPTGCGRARWSARGGRSRRWSCSTRSPPSGDPAFAATTEGGRLTARWALGDVDTVAARDARRSSTGSGPPGWRRTCSSGSPSRPCCRGRPSAISRRRRRTWTRHATPRARPAAGPRPGLALAEATLLAAAGDEAAAAALLEDAIARTGCWPTAATGAPWRGGAAAHLRARARLPRRLGRRRPARATSTTPGRSPSAVVGLRAGRRPGGAVRWSPAGSRRWT